MLRNKKSSATTTKNKVNIVIIGDSFVQGVGDEKNDGWTGIFRKKFGDKFNIIVKGYGGNNIYDVISRLEKDLFPYQPSIVILEVGINDSRLRKSLNFSNEVPPDKFRKGLEDFVNRIRSRLGKDILFIFIGTTPVIDELVSPYKEDKYYSTFEAKKYNEIIRQFCESNNIVFVDVFKKFNSKNLKEVLSDGVHPNFNGYQIIASEVITHFKKVIQDATKGGSAKGSAN